MSHLIHVLFVCLGNICRSPAAEAILKARLKEENIEDVVVDSCGMGSWHVGQHPDINMQRAAKNRGLALTGRAKQFQDSDFDRFDYIFAADVEVYHALQQRASKLNQKSKIYLNTAFSTRYKDQDLPDPYQKPSYAFEMVLDMLEDSTSGFIHYINSIRK